MKFTLIFFKATIQNKRYLRRLKVYPPKKKAELN